MGQGQKRKKHSPSFKLKVVLEALRENDDAKVARKYDLAYSLVGKWKDRMQKEGTRVFETTADQEKKKLEKQLSKLERLVGQKEVELNLLKNFSDFYQSRDTG